MGGAVGACRMGECAWSGVEKLTIGVLAWVHARGGGEEQGRSGHEPTDLSLGSMTRRLRLRATHR